MSDAPGPPPPPDGSSWGDHGSRRWRGGPPPWWPADEPWPPSDRDWGRRRRATRRAGWHRAGAGGQGFVLRIGCAIVVFLAVLTVAFTIAITLVGGLLGLVGISSDARLAALVILGLGIAALGVLARSLGQTAEPIGELIEASARVEEGDLTVRVRERGPAGVRQLVRSFNAMSARLEADAESRRSLMADITHELRTPLTVIQGNLEGVIDGVYPADETHLGTILDETKTLGRLIDDLRTLALADRGALELRREPVDLVALVEEGVAAARAAADGASVSCRVAPSPPGTPAPVVDADPTRVREVLGNLLANAIRHTPPGGSVTVGVHGGAELATVAVTDTGSGIPPDLVGRVFERFVRDPGSSGTGLGLAIARDLVVAHGGTIEATSPPGAGTTVSFTLPLAG